jgi:hypothetical protein
MGTYYIGGNMGTYYLGVIMVFFLLSCIVATSSMGIECYDKEQSLKTEKKSNYTALWVGALLPFAGMFLYGTWVYFDPFHDRP